MSKTFTPGMLVKFPGLTAGKIKIPVIQGQLVKNDRNTTVPGVMSIVGDKHGMLFLPDGTIYCHGQFGPMLESLTNEEAEDTPRKADGPSTEEVVQLLNTPLYADQKEVEEFADKVMTEHAELFQKLKDSGD